MTAPLLLYSTNTHLKYRIQERYRSEHHVWCSPSFSAAKLNKYAMGSGTPPSADPASIYRDLYEAVRRTDEHNSKILDQKKIVKAEVYPPLPSLPITVPGDPKDRFASISHTVDSQGILRVGVAYCIDLVKYRADLRTHGVKVTELGAPSQPSVITTTTTRQRLPKS